MLLGLRSGESPLSEASYSNPAALVVFVNGMRGTGCTSVVAGSGCVRGCCTLTDVMAVDIEAVAVAGDCDAWDTDSF